MLHCDVLMVDDNEKPVMGGPQVSWFSQESEKRWSPNFGTLLMYVALIQSGTLLWKVWAVNLRPEALKARSARPTP